MTWEKHDPGPLKPWKALAENMATRVFSHSPEAGMGATLDLL